MIQERIRAAKARDEERSLEDGQAASSLSTAGPTELRRAEGQSTLRIGLRAAAASATGGANISNSKRPRLPSAFETDADESNVDDKGAAIENGSSSKSSSKGKGKRSVMEVLMEQEEARKATKRKEEIEEEKSNTAKDSDGGNRRDYWLLVGIVVKIMNKKVGGGKYYKKKARLRKVIERYVGEVKMLDSGDRLRVDQEDLETVSPTNHLPIIDELRRSALRT